MTSQPVVGRRRVARRVGAGFLLTAIGLAAGGLWGAPAREVISLDGPWQFRRDEAGQGHWKQVPVPSSFQSHEGTNFHGVGWYRKRVGPLAVQAGERLLVEFQAAATEAEVWWDGHKVGHHLGGWTPFRCDVTAWVRPGSAKAAHELKLRLDEKVGHNTQGFLPVIEPHFGGVWQAVRLLTVPETYIDDLRLLAVGNPRTGRIELEFPLAGEATPAPETVTVRYRLRGTTGWHSESLPVARVISMDDGAGTGKSRFRVEVPVPGFKRWWPDAPNLYEVELGLAASQGGDVVLTRAAFRSIEACGTELLLNGKPLSVRGLLNWGYSPPRLAPNPGAAAFRRELEFARRHGFNLMKFCLWVPPKGYLDLADEMGLLTWEEYPTWHPTMTGEYLAPLEREFGEFFDRDRNHPSVILRSLTCETGSGAESGVLEALYQRAHAMVPRAVVEDDSSWIQWNRFTDFWDDHPYGNNETWVSTLHALTSYVLAHGAKPLVLGEAIAADTWLDGAAVRDQLGAARPFWAPAILDAQPRWVARIRAIAGAEGLGELGPDSLRYALLMRKYQVEAYRREVPYGGYVVSVIRDIPKASMGLLDYLGRPKWPAADWAWQGDTMLLLQTAGDRRSFWSGARFQASVLISHFGFAPLTNARLTVTVERADGGGGRLQRMTQTGLEQNCGTLARGAELDFTLPDVDRPQPLRVRAVLESRQGRRANAWRLWVVPSLPRRLPCQVWTDPSVSKATAAELFPGAAPWPTNRTDGVVAAVRFSDALVRLLNRGGRVLFLPDGGKDSFPLKAHWFLQGAPYLPESPLLRRAPRDLLVDLQAFDLASRVIPDVSYLDAIDPMLMLWDTHDSAVVKTHALVFETRAGRGRLLVSALRHRGANNAAGQWLLSQLLEILATGSAPRHGLSPRLWRELQGEIKERNGPVRLETRVLRTGWAIRK